MIFKVLLGAAIGAVVGAGVGFIGKSSGGQCPLVCNPLGALIIGAFMGAVLLSSTARSAPEKSGIKDGGVSSRVVQIGTPEQLDGILKAGGVVLVDFFAEWCGPCKALKPTIHEIAEEYSGKITVAAVNVDKVAALAEKYGIESIPDVRLFSGGNEVQKFIGTKPKDAYTGAIEKQIGKNGAKPASEGK